MHVLKKGVGYKCSSPVLAAHQLDECLHTEGTQRNASVTGSISSLFNWLPRSLVSPCVYGRLLLVGIAVLCFMKCLMLSACFSKHALSSTFESFGRDLSIREFSN